MVIAATSDMRMSPLIVLMSSKCYSFICFTDVNLRFGEELNSHCLSDSRQM